MDRKLFYPGQIPLSAQFLQAERHKLVGLGWLAQGVFGSAMLADGLECIPTVPATLTVQVLPGQFFELSNVDGMPYGQLTADTRNIIKQGVNLDTTAFTLIPPSTSGHAINYLIQASIEEVDEDPLVLPYVNSNNPAQPWTGPNNSGISQPTTRKLKVSLVAKAGTSASAGTQVTPTADTGYVGLYAVTVAYGASQLTSNEIKQLDAAPFLFKKLPELPRWVQSGEFLWGNDIGTKNAIVAKLNPVPTQYKAGMHVFIKKMATANDGNVTVNLMGPEGSLLGAVALLDATGAQIAPGNLTGSFVIHAVYDGTAFRWVNGSITNTSISSITATSGEGVTVGGSAPYPVSLNFPGLSEATPTPLDLFAFYDHEGSHHKAIKYSDLLALMVPSIAPGLVNLQAFTDTGTYNKTAGARKALVFCTAPGGGGGSSGETGGGGGAGETSIALVDLTGVTSVAIVLGNQGGGGNNSAGGDGGDAQFGTYAKSKGGKGGGPRGRFNGGDTNGTGGSGGKNGGIGLVSLPGGAGTPGGPIDGGTGGASFWGGGGRPGDHNNIGTPNGGAGEAPGSGGGGSDGGGLGGQGAKGLVLVLEFA